ncbi:MULTISPECIES: hypothetical protein [unclassified Nocardioides]|uniref:hypothetical protein n=1 Tax=unclassified Nocardioides TaxID=2615069 RepID=UPI0000570D2D|nr:MULTISPECIES: hypothetical protein [unclassified Nocardioides]ABL80010.1 hypothetical protein Noca_0468 [Nocardioides sp. JS614]
MPALTRGPLPARVYWVRRLLVLGTATLLVVAIARLLGGGSDAASEPDAGAQLVADGSPTAAATLDGEPTTTTSARKPGKRASKSQEPVLAQPDGPCADEDVAITPKVENAVAGRPVQIVLQLRTLESDACTWRVSAGTVTVNITSGPDDIWTSRQCRRAIPARDVVVRKAVTSNVSITWSSRRSDDGCTRLTDWAYPGWYHVTAAALAGEPSDAQFELRTPTAATITKTVTPTQKPSQKPSQSASGRPVTPGQGQSASPSGAVEPN